MIERCSGENAEGPLGSAGIGKLNQSSTISAGPGQVEEGGKMFEAEEEA